MLHTYSGNEVEQDRSFCVQVGCPLEAHGRGPEKVRFNCTVILSVESLVGPRYSECRRDKSIEVVGRIYLRGLSSEPAA